MSWIESMARYLQWAGLLAMGVGLALAWREGRRPSWRGLLRWRPLWKQREDFSSVGWKLWVTGLALLFLYLFVRFIWIRSA